MAGGCVPVMCVGWFSSFFAGLFFLKNHRAEIPHSDGVGEVFFSSQKALGGCRKTDTNTVYTRETKTPESGPRCPRCYLQPRSTRSRVLTQRSEHAVWLSSIFS